MNRCTDETYGNPDETTLSYTVTKGNQPYEIDLTP